MERSAAAEWFLEAHHLSTVPSVPPVQLLGESRSRECARAASYESKLVGRVWRVPETQGRVTITTTASCVKLSKHDGRSLCHKSQTPDDAHWKQCCAELEPGSFVPSGYAPYTKMLSAMGCYHDLNENAENAPMINNLKENAKGLISAGHSFHIQLMGMQPWPGKRGLFMVYRASGSAKGETEVCTMEAGMQMFVCRTCGCNQKFVKVPTATKLTRGRQKHCGNWFVDASTVFQLMFATKRADMLMWNPKMLECTRKDPPKQRKLTHAALPHSRQAAVRWFEL